MSSNLVSKDLPIVWKDDPEYEEARTRVFPLSIPDRFPKAVVRPTQIDHVVEAVNLAKALGSRVSVRSGGHSWACWSIRQDAILIDFVDYKHTKYNPDSEIAELSPGTTSEQTCEFLESHGRFLPAGHCGDVGLGGFILQGGMGLNARGDGWLCSYLVAIEVVTAEGKVLHCDEQQNEDLFWAARGAGPGFPAIVTKFFLKTRPSLPIHRRSLFVYLITSYDEVMNWMVKVMPSINRDVEPLVTALNTVERGYTIMIMAAVRAKTEEEALQKLSILSETHPTGALMVEYAAPTTYREEYQLGNQALPEGHRWRVDNVYIDASYDLTSVCRQSWTTLPVGGTAYWEPMNPVSREPMKDMALTMQTDNYIALYAAYKDPKEDLLQQEWITRSMESLLPYAVGSYLGDFDFQTRSSKFWSEKADQRLKSIRQKYNPNNLVCGYLDKGDASGVAGLRNELPSPSSKI